MTNTTDGLSKRMRKIPDVADLRRLLDYDPLTGQLHWRVRVSCCVKPGHPAGYVTRRGYVHVTVGGVEFCAHRVIWAMAHGVAPPDGMQIDHIDGNRSNNRLENLRLASNAENGQNMIRRPNQSGHMGVSWKADRKKWIARIRTKGQSHEIGAFDSAEAAGLAYVEAKAKLHTFNPTIRRRSVARG